MSRKRMIYITTYDFDVGESSGVVKKIREQIKVFSQNGFEVDYFFTSGKEKVLYLVGKKKKKLSKVKFIKSIDYWSAIKKYLKKNMYDCAYVRHTGRIDLWVLATLKELHRNETRTVYEFPTFPYDKTTAVNFMGRIDMFVDCFCRKKLKKYVNKVITYDGYSCIYGIPTIKAINGICVDEISTLSTRSEKDEISLLAVAAFHDYHGYDRIINAMGIYYKQGGTRNIVLHLVGTGNIVESYKNIVAKYKLENRVIFHGSKFGNELERIYEQADIGLGVFGLYLIGADISSALKVREYLAKGLPVISGCKEDAFENENKYFYLEFANNDSLIDMRDIIQFFDNIYSNRNRKEIHDEIRQYAKSKVDWSSTLMPIIGYFKETEK